MANSISVTRLNESRSEARRAAQAAVAIFSESAQEAEAIQYQLHEFVQFSLPHGRCKTRELTVRNGKSYLHMVARPDRELPYGALPRLTTSWLASEVVRTKKREIELGDSLSQFMRRLDLTPTGGRWGSIPRVRRQVTNLFSARFTAYSVDDALDVQVN